MEYLIENIRVFIPDDYGDCDMVMQVIVPQPAGRIGGSDTHVLQLSAQQKLTGFLKPVVLFCRNPEYEEKLRALGVAYISCVNEHKLTKILKSIGKITFADRIKVIHSHQYNANFLTYAIKKRFKKTFGKIPTVMTCHGWIENNLKDRFFTMLDFASYSVADALITVCEKDLFRLNKKGKYSNKELTLIPNGVLSIKHFKDKEICDFKRKHNIKSGLKTIAYVGRLAQEKRVDGFIECCKELISNGERLNCLIVGSGDLDLRLKTMAEKNHLQEYIKFTGFIDPIDIVYSVIDLLLITSDTEGTPRCALEAMSAGVPIIATNVGGLKEIVNEKNGYLVNKGDYKTMAKIIQNCIQDDIRLKQLSENCKNTIKKRFDITKMQQKIDVVYKKIYKEGK